MKLGHRSALLCLVCASLPLAIACGSNDSGGLFSSGGSSSTGGSSLGISGTTAQAGHTTGGSSSSNAGSSGSTNVAGQGTSGGDTGGSGVAGSGAGGMSVGGAGGSTTAGTGGDTSGTGGAGGAGGAGGTSAGAGGSSAGAGGANAGTGGVVGGSGGSSGSAGAGGLDGCPLSPPTNGLGCLVATPNSCFYPGADCDCIPQNGGGVSVFKGKWSCIGSRPPACTQDLPMTGDACMGHSSAQCPYSSTDACVCFGDTAPKWDCSADKNFTCPASAPNPGSNCSTVAMCQYASGDCLCNSFKWVCQGG